VVYGGAEQDVYKRQKQLSSLELSRARSPGVNAAATNLA
jgi:hypothetical protein